MKPKKICTLNDGSIIYDMIDDKIRYTRIYKSGRIESFTQATLCSVKGKRSKWLEDIKNLKLVDEGFVVK